MKEQLITFETAKLAKDKGFDISIKQENSVYDMSTGKIDINITSNKASNWIAENLSLRNDKKYIDICSAPTQSLLQKWLREKHNIDVVISPERYSNGVNYLVQAQKWDLNADPEVNLNFVIKGSCWYNDNHEYPTYEEALEKGLQEALKLIEL